MESSPDLLSLLLGIEFPVHLLAVNLDSASKQLAIDVETPIDHVADHTDDWSLWHHLPLGGYGVRIRAKTKSAPLGAEGFNRDHLQDPAILGPANRPYTHALRQRVAIAFCRGCDAKVIAALISPNTDDLQSIVEQILEDIKNSSPLNQLLCCLPSEQDVIWSRLLSGEAQLKTQNLAFQLLLSKWQSLMPMSPEARLAGIHQLRKYLLVHGAQLIDEIKFIAGLPLDEDALGASYDR